MTHTERLRTPGSSASRFSPCLAVHLTSGCTRSSNSTSFCLCPYPRKDSVSPMRVEIVDDTENPAAVAVFPPGENYVDLRQNSHGVERIAAARAYLPLRNFLTAVNSPESVFATLTASVECKSSVAEDAGEVHEFSSWT